MTHGASCLCLTYGRPKLLEEALESFLKQTYAGPKELLIINDLPTQTLIFEHPEVTIVNLPRRIRTLGEKRNFSVSLAKYENLVVWDDDDIYLPWRLEETLKTLPKDHFFKCPNAWIMDDNKINKEPGYNLFHGGSAFTRWLWEQVGGYKAMNGGEDADIELKFQKVRDGRYWPKTTLPKDKLYYIYRWNHGSYHTTGQTDLNNIKPSNNDPIWLLEPKWHQNYYQLAAEAAGNSPKSDYCDIPEDIIAQKQTIVVQSEITMTKSNNPIHLICFSKNRPLQLDGYLRSVKLAFGLNCPDISVLYTCGHDYDGAYSELKKRHKAKWLKQSDFCKDLLSLFNDAKFVLFGCDDVVYTGEVDVSRMLGVMENEKQFAFSLRLGCGLKKSMFSGTFDEPHWEYSSDGQILTWDLHKSHQFGDYGYSWELDGTLYFSEIAKQVIQEVKPTSPNILEANGGGKWSNKTKRSLISCFEKAKLIVPTVNVVQSNFGNPVIGKEVGTKFLLDAWNCGMELDIERYRGKVYDAIHVGDFWLAKV